MNLETLLNDLDTYSGQWGAPVTVQLPNGQTHPIKSTFPSHNERGEPVVVIEVGRAQKVKHRHKR